MYRDSFVSPTVKQRHGVSVNTRIRGLCWKEGTHNLSCMPDSYFKIPCIMIAYRALFRGPIEFALYPLFFFCAFSQDVWCLETSTRHFGWIRAEEVKAQWSALVHGILYVGNSTDTQTHTLTPHARACEGPPHTHTRTHTHVSRRTPNEQRTARAAMMNMYWLSRVSSTHGIAG
jgi:hypothetical protein